MWRFFGIIITLIIFSLYGAYLYIVSEVEYLKTFVPEININTSKESEIKLVVYGGNGLEMYKEYFRRSKNIPDDYDMTKIIFLTDKIIKSKQNLQKTYGIERWKLFLIKNRGIDPFSLKGVVLNHYANNLLSENSLTGFKAELVRWFTLSKLNKTYDSDKLYRMYLDTPTFGENIYGIAAAAEYYFAKSIKEISILETAFLIAMVSKEELITPKDDFSYLDKYARIALKGLYEEGFITLNEYNNELSGIIKIVENKPFEVIEPSYVAEVLNRIKQDDRFKIGEETIKIYTGYNKDATDIARKAIETSLRNKDKRLQISFVLVNKDTKSVEVAIGNRNYNSKSNRAFTLKRQMASTFKPIVYIAAFEKGYKPNDRIIDKPYKFKVGRSTYSPRNYEDFFMGNIPLRYGLIYSLNNATVRLAEKAGLIRVRNMAVDIGMNSTVMPFHAMALGSFSATALNVAQMYSTLGNFGVRSIPNLILRVEAGDKVYDMREEPKVVFSNKTAMQVLKIMQDVVNRGTARGAKMLPGTAAKTGTSDNYRDAWTVALFGSYVAVCWVGYDDYSSMGEDSSGGRMAAPVISRFQREFFPKGTTFSFTFPANNILNRAELKKDSVAVLNE